MKLALKLKVFLLYALLFAQRLIVTLIARLRTDHDPRRSVDVLHYGAQFDLRRFTAVLGVRALRTAVFVIVVRVRCFRFRDSIEAVVFVGRMQCFQNIAFVPFDWLSSGLEEKRKNLIHPKPNKAIQIKKRKENLRRFGRLAFGLFETGAGF